MRLTCNQHSVSSDSEVRWSENLGAYAALNYPEIDLIHSYKIECNQGKRKELSDTVHLFVLSEHRPLIHTSPT